MEPADFAALCLYRFHLMCDGTFDAVVMHMQGIEWHIGRVVTKLTDVSIVNGPRQKKKRECFLLFAC